MIKCSNQWSYPAIERLRSQVVTGNEEVETGTMWGVDGHLYARSQFDVFQDRIKARSDPGLSAWCCFLSSWYTKISPPGLFWYLHFKFFCIRIWCAWQIRSSKNSAHLLRKIWISIISFVLRHIWISLISFVSWICYYRYHGNTPNTPLQACSHSWDREPLRNTNTSTKWVNGLKSSNIRLIHDFSAGKPIPIYLPFST